MMTVIHIFVYPADDAVTLCHAAQSIGPADCFIESRNLGSVSERINLCNGAQNNVRRGHIIDWWTVFSV